MSHKIVKEFKTLALDREAIAQVREILHHQFSAMLESEIAQGSLSAATSMASKRRSMRSVRHSLANSTAARNKLPLYFSSCSPKVNDAQKIYGQTPGASALSFPRVSRALKQLAITETMVNHHTKAKT